jgi:hypothetical protein
MAKATGSRGGGSRTQAVYSETLATDSQNGNAEKRRQRASLALIPKMENATAVHTIASHPTMRQQLISPKTFWLARRGGPARRPLWGPPKSQTGLPGRRLVEPGRSNSRAWGRGHEVAGMSRNSLQKDSRSSPFLTGSYPQTEFDVTLSKQTPEKFLTGARMHISVSLKRISNRKLTMRRANVAGLHSPPCTRAFAARFSSFLTETDSQTEIAATPTKQTTEKFLTGTRTAISVSRKHTKQPPRMAAFLGSKAKRAAKMAALRKANAAGLKAPALHLNLRRGPPKSRTGLLGP